MIFGFPSIGLVLMERLKKLPPKEQSNMSTIYAIGKAQYTDNVNYTKELASYSEISQSAFMELIEAKARLSNYVSIRGAEVENDTIVYIEE